MTDNDTVPMMRIAACSYEGSIFGWNVLEDSNGEGLVAPMSFGFNCSQGSLKTLAVSSGGRYLCCGGTDERIRIFNVAENRSMGELGLHEGAITALDFFEDSHMISGSEDNMLRIWRCHDWECVHILSGHKEPITSVSIHPSGKLALSVSKDNTMKLWNLVQGRCSFTRRLRGAADKVFWHPSGEYYMLIVQMEIQIYRAADNACTASIQHKTRVNQAAFTMCGSEPDGSTTTPSVPSYMRVACICEDKTLHLYDLDGKETASLDVTGMDGRPRDMWSCKLALDIPEGDQKADGTIASVLAEEGACLTVVTSLGRISVISCKSVEAGNTLEECTLVSTQVKMEPRLTGVVSWSTTLTKNSQGPMELDEGEGLQKKVKNTVDSRKRPRDTSSAHGDITAEKELKKQQEADAALSSSKKKKIQEFKDKANANLSTKGKGQGSEGSTKGKEKGDRASSGKKDGKREVSFSPPATTSSASDQKKKAKGKGQFGGKKNSSKEKIIEDTSPQPKEKNNVYYKKR